MTHKAEGYKEYELRTHIYNISDSYVGSTEKLTRKERIVDFSSTNWKFDNVEIDIPPAVIKCFMEIMTNASDNAIKSANEGVNPGTIKVKVTDEKVVIQNSGIVIPVVKRGTKKGEMYVPELIFGNLLTSSNYEGPRTGGGRNGYGAKLVNIFSKRFLVEICDTTNKKLYKQEWTNNMKNRGDPVVKSSRSSKPFVRITYELDFARFDMERFSRNDIGLFARYCADISYTCGVKVSYNGKSISIKNTDAFASKLFPNNNNKISFSCSGSVRRKIPANIGSMSKEEYNKFTAEVCIVDSQNSRSYSYTNGMENNDGGIHHDAVLHSFSECVRKKINSSPIAKKFSSKITKRDIRGKVSIIVSVNVIDPTFEGQMKSKLNSPNMNIQMPKDLLSKIDNWKFTKMMYKILGVKSDSLSQKTDGKKTKYVKVNSAEDANEAGGRNSHRCSLYIVEGLSATGYITHGLEHGDRNFVGIYPMRGKPLNATKASEVSYAENRVVKEIKEMLGLREGLDYTIEKNYRTLRYGKVIIAADADVDGTHIASLVVNIFNERYKSLIKRGFLLDLRTPIIKAYKGNKSKEFYSEEQFRKWDGTSESKGYRHKYHKGLGGFKPSEAKAHFKNPKMPEFVHDKNADKSLKLAFCPSMARERRNWIQTKIGKVIPIGEKKIEISDYIDMELISYSSRSVKRSIPVLMDGLKDVQRRILQGSMLYWKTNTRSAISNCKPIEVYRLAAIIAESTKYLHGPASLENSIVEMANKYPGSNNMGMFEQEGLFGTRNGTIKGCGKDASKTRYCMVRPKPWWAYIYRSEDIPLLEIRVEDGKETCPKYFLPIIPMVLVNGAKGIATGWSTYIPCHNPLDICKWIKDKIKGKETKDVFPWFSGFTGDVQIINRRNPKPNIEVDDVSAEENDEEKEVETLHKEDGSVSYEPISLKDIDPSSKLALRTVGKFSVDDDKVTVSEIPIGVGIHNYGIWLKHLCTEEKSIKSYKNLSTANVPKFEIKGMKNPSLRKLKLYKSYGLGIMNCLDNDENPKLFKTSNDILEEFYKIRLPLYSKRRDMILSNMENELDLIDNRIKFINLVAVEKKIQVMHVREGKVYEQMESFGIKRKEDVYKSTKISNCSTEYIEKLSKKSKSMRQEMDTIKSTTPKQMWLNDIREFESMYKKTSI